MERVFFLLTRWLMLIGATMAFLFLIGGGIYTFNLYQVSQDKDINEEAYPIKNPQISFEMYKKEHTEKELITKDEQLNIEKYVLNIINNGSSGHNYPMGAMPPGMVSRKNAKKVATWVSKGMMGTQLEDFTACAACHGSDGKGMNGMTPDLTKLPIYYELMSNQNQLSVAKEEVKIEKIVEGNEALKKYSSKIVSYLNKYSILVGQNGVESDKVFDFILELSNKYDNDLFLSFQKELDSGLQKLLIDGEAFKKSKKDTKEAILWREYLDWFIMNFDEQVDSENNKYNSSITNLEEMKIAKQQEAILAQVEMYTLFGGLGIALLVFILLTMILVLFKIELNTRKIIEDKGEE